MERVRRSAGFWGVYWALALSASVGLSLTCVYVLPGSWWSSFTTNLMLLPSDRVRITVMAGGTGSWTTPESITLTGDSKAIEVDPKTLACRVWTSETTAPAALLGE